MSEENDNDSGTMLCCASCGIAEIDSVKLKKCTACYRVKYCGVECQRDHWSKHKKDCKKRVAELRDELLFKQPESTNRGDCPICMLPLSFDLMTTMMTCCSKEICRGCTYANYSHETVVSVVPKWLCPFCRKAVPDTVEEGHKQRMKRIEVNDPVAIRQEGGDQYQKGNYTRAFEYWTKAADLGDAEAHYQLSGMYFRGEGVEKEERKHTYHLEEAAIAGHPDARHGLGCEEWNNGNTERAVKHLIIAATQGYDDSIKGLMDAFKGGYVNRDVLTTALRAHQAAVDATKSPQRETAEEFYSK